MLQTLYQRHLCHCSRHGLNRHVISSICSIFVCLQLHKPAQGSVKRMYINGSMHEGRHT